MVLQACLAGLAGCGLLSLWPFRFARRWKSWNLYLPVAGLACYGAYEWALPSEVDVARKMAFIVPLMIFLWLNGMAKVAILKWLQDHAHAHGRHLRSMPQRKWQLLAALPVAVGCLAWGWWAWN